MVRAPPSRRCSKEQMADHPPHLHNFAGCGPSNFDILAGCWNHSALDRGAGVAAPPPPPRHKPFTHHTKPPHTHRTHRPDAQRSHSRSLLVCCLGSLDSHSMTAGGAAARPKDFFSCREARGQAVGGADGRAAAVCRSSQPIPGFRGRFFSSHQYRA